MNAKLKSLYWRLRTPDSVASALKQIVDPSQVEKLELGGLRGGKLLEAISAERGLDVGSLLMAVGNLLDLATLDAQYVPDRSISSEFGISENFLEANNALVCRHEQNKLLLVADLSPELKVLARKHKLEICLGLLSNIKNSWQNYRNLSLTSLSLTSGTVNTKQLEFVLRNLVIDADSLGATQIEISANNGAYNFSADAEIFEGSIHPLVASTLLKWLEGKVKVKAKLVSEWQEPVVFYRKTNNEVIVVTWNKKQAEKSPKKSPVVLLLEDDRLFSTVLKSTLERNGYQVFCFYTAELAIAAISAQELIPQLVISDLHLPGMNGDEFLEQFREIHSDVPFVILTSDQDQLIEANIVLKGVGAYLKKNEDIRVILAWCSQLLKKNVD